MNTKCNVTFTLCSIACSICTTWTKLTTHSDLTSYWSVNTEHSLSIILSIGAVLLSPNMPSNSGFHWYWLFPNSGTIMYTCVSVFEIVRCNEVTDCGTRLNTDEFIWKGVMVVVELLWKQQQLLLHWNLSKEWDHAKVYQNADFVRKLDVQQ